MVSEWISVAIEISIHAPRGGSDGNNGFCDQGKLCISIHAPRGGSDSVRGASASMRSYFNPRSPWGERPAYGMSKETAYSISIHAPRGGSDLGCS